MKAHCPICDRFMIRPVGMKRCGHYFCLECLNEVSEYAMKDPLLKKLKAPDGTIRCPLCREVGFSSQAIKKKRDETAQPNEVIDDILAVNPTLEAIEPWMMKSSTYRKEVKSDITNQANLKDTWYMGKEFIDRDLAMQLQASNPAEYAERLEEDNKARI